MTPKNYVHISITRALASDKVTASTYNKITFGAFVAYTTREFHYKFMEVLLWALLEYTQLQPWPCTTRQLKNKNSNKVPSLM